jgi:hypothetical protein
MKPMLDAGFSGIFSQNWSLFAPNPVAQDYVLLIQPLQTNQISQLQTEKWYNISTSLWQRFHKNRFSAYDRLARSQTSALKALLTGDPRLFAYHKACQKGDTASCRIFRQLIDEIRTAQTDKIVKISSAFCNAISTTDQLDYHYFSARLRIFTFPPWSERNTGKKVFQDIDLGIHPINKNIASFDVFR